MKFIFIQTGGTIDKDYPYKTKGWEFLIGDPAIARILEKLNSSFEYDVITCFRKDSLEITIADRQFLADMIKKHPDNKFIITHGTDTMIETATYLQAEIHNKLIVMTGSMLPERFANSEAPVNVGCAIAAANLLDSGVFIAMHGVVKSSEAIRRDLNTGKFY